MWALMPAITARASACQPRLRSHEINGKIVNPCPSGGNFATSASTSFSEVICTVLPSQGKILPPSLSAPPKSARLASTKYNHRPGGGTTCSGATTTRIALEVPIVKANLSSLTQPEPILAAAPSPMAGNQGTLRKGGQREA